MQTITLLLDEVLPCDAEGDDGCGGTCGGVTHEMELTDATIKVHCADLTATWGSAGGGCR